MAESPGDRILHDICRLVALQLLEVGAVLVRPSQPFRLTSGNFSPIYVDCRRLISFPAFVDIFCAAVRALVSTRRLEFDVVAGGETAGIPFAAIVSRAFGLPMIYVRKKTKEHGAERRIEGVMAQGARVLLVEDLVTDAASKIGFIDAIAASGGLVRDVVVVFDRLQGAADSLARRGITLHALATMHSVLDVGEQTADLNSADLVAVREYLDSPSDWHRARGLAFADGSRS